MERFELFKERLSKIVKHNQEGSASYKQGINEFTFKLPQELEGFKSSQNCSATVQYAPLRTYNMEDLPEQVDWREKGVVS